VHADAAGTPHEGLGAQSILVIVGTRPEMIKLEGIVELLGDSAVVAATGQHYDDILVHRQFVQLPVRSIPLERSMGALTRAKQIAAGVESAIEAIEKVQPRCVIVQGDTNTALAGALAANAAEVPLIHVEAGLRSFDRRMPEEHNRVLVDHMADLLLAPTEVNRSNLLREGLADQSIRVTGNTVVDAVDRHMPAASVRARVVTAHGLESGRFILATLHRPENVDSRTRVAELLALLDSAPLPVVLTVHPRWRALVPDDVRRFTNLELVEPLEYADFLALFAESAAAITDSGGLQEEATVVKKPTLVIRRSTERPEAIGSFTTLAKTISEARAVLEGWRSGTEDLQEVLQATPSPYGDHGSSQRCVESIVEFLA